MEDLEQPNETGSNYGKFKDAEGLLKAYNNLEAEFTKKSQKLAQFEQEKSTQEQIASKRAEIDKRVEDFVNKFEIVKPFSSALKESLIATDTADLGEEAVKCLSNNYKRAEDYINDDEFLNKFVYANQGIRDKIIKDYLSQITQNSPIKMDSSSTNILLSKPNLPTTISEAGKLAKSIIKQK